MPDIVQAVREMTAGKAVSVLVDEHAGQGGQGWGRNRYQMRKTSRK